MTTPGTFLSGKFRSIGTAQLRILAIRGFPDENFKKRGTHPGQGLPAHGRLPGGRVRSRTVTGPFSGCSVGIVGACDASNSTASVCRYPLDRGDCTGEDIPTVYRKQTEFILPQNVSVELSERALVIIFLKISVNELSEEPRQCQGSVVGCLGATCRKTERIAARPRAAPLKRNQAPKSGEQGLGPHLHFTLT
ncbi:MAG: hypothetical protein LBD10_06435 [Desulfobulbus sp.]|jgi:hypothetical protein|uniref:hypothetical protein n=1 Tax=Desulfobulbus sp. TaxID=895 RepID=UPI00284925BD|nr:hypothetical protein [Desulfobulbus sp.]MDR2549816.1 hypothetical protein [Desulfobulbus sp.]